MTICTKCGTPDQFIGAGTKLDARGRWRMVQCKNCGHRQKAVLLAPPGQPVIDNVNKEV